jgi:hypothetical protein
MKNVNLSHLTVRRLKAEIKKILANPHLYDQASVCGSAFCFAADGYINYRRARGMKPVQSLDRIVPESILKFGGQWFGVNPRSSRLFYRPDEWPTHFARRYANAGTAEERAKVGAAAIADFIRLDGKGKWRPGGIYP